MPRFGRGKTVTVYFFMKLSTLRDVHGNPFSCTGSCSKSCKSNMAISCVAVMDISRDSDVQPLGGSGSAPEAAGCKGAAK